MWDMTISALRMAFGLIGFAMMVLFIVNIFSFSIVLAYVIAKEIIRDGILDKGEWFKKDETGE
jgi:hypothetical protein